MQHGVGIMFYANLYGVWIVLNEVYALRVSILMAWRITIRCWVSVGMAMHVKQGPWLGCIRVGFMVQAWQAVGSVLVGTIFGTGRMPGVLLHITQQCSHGVFFKTCFAVRLHVSMTSGASVRRGRVMMGEASTDLCSASCIAC